jgi:hypothetical protein
MMMSPSNAWSPSMRSIGTDTSLQERQNSGLKIRKTNVVGQRSTRADIAKGGPSYYQQAFGNSTIHETVISINYLKPDVGGVDVAWEMIGAKCPDGSDASYRVGLNNLVMTKVRGKWLIAIFHNMDFPGRKRAGITPTISYGRSSSWRHITPPARARTARARRRRTQPAVELGLRRAASLPRQRVELAAAVVFGGAPFGLNQALFFHAIQRRIERPLFHAQHIIGELMQPHRDGVAVIWSRPSTFNTRRPACPVADRLSAPPLIRLFPDAAYLERLGECQESTVC